jgi:hypothetical protein
MPVRCEGIPSELKSLPQWVAWRHELREDKWTKPPVSPITGKYAASTDATTWAPFDAALDFAQRERLAGIGLVVTRRDRNIGIDIDKCRNPETGEIEPWAAEIIARFDSYTEITPSGTGVRIYIRGDESGVLPDGRAGRRKGSIEIYGADRFFTVTGQCIGQTRTIEERSEDLAALCAELFAPPHDADHASHRHGSAALADDDVLSLARNAGNGTKFFHLWAGDTSEYGGDDSAADLALLGVLSFYSQDPDQLDRLFRRSGLYRDKWERADYRQRTIDKALTRSEVYKSLNRDTGPGRNGASAHADESGHQRRGPRGEQEPAVRLSGDGREYQPPDTPWPVLDPAALYGLPGDIVKAIDPHTEGDPVAILINLIGMFGSAVGRSPHVQVGATRHGTNTFFALVGKTSRSRKGTAHDESLRLVARADIGWRDRVVGGLSSGEGLIHAVRDPSYKIVKGESVMDDAGVEDKRLCVVEPEFASVLKVGRRDGNTVTEILRRAWDGNDLRTLTRNSPLVATNPHITLIGHITEDELRRTLDDTSQTNGYFNRFAAACVQRSKELPEGGSLPEADIAILATRLQAAIDAARKRSLIVRDPDARAMWKRVYPELTKDRPGMLGAITARAEAHALRFSLLYALLDCAPAIQCAHLEAALALWEYCEDSVRYIFGDATGDPTSDRVYSAIRNSPEGMTQSALMDLFGRNLPAAKIAAALETLVRLRRITSEQVATGGRPSTVWKLTL